MEPREPPGEEELAAFLPEDPASFVDFLVDYWGEKIVACIGLESLDSLDTAETEDALQETLIAIWERVSDPSFEPQRPLRMVFTIAKRKAIDAYRKKMRLKKHVVVDSPMTDLLIADMQGSDLSLAWKFADEYEKSRLLEVLPGIVGRLPPRQKSAVLAFKECYADIRAKNKYRLIADAMSQITGQPETIAAAKSALRAGLEKVRNELVRLGIGFVEGSGK